VRDDLRARGHRELTVLGPPRKDEESTFVASDGRRTVWAANTNSRTVARLDPDTGRILVRVVGLTSAGIAEGYGAVWVPVPKDDLVVRLDIRTGRVRARIPVSGNPRRVAVGEGGVWVITTGVHSAVWRIDPKNNETVAVIPVPPKARRIATGEGSVWVTSGRDEEERVHRRGMLSRIDPRTNTIVASVKLGFRPDGVVVANELVWVAVAPL
jgi:streptogramin lyase